VDAFVLNGYFFVTRLTGFSSDKRQQKKGATILYRIRTPLSVCSRCVPYTVVRFVTIAYKVKTLLELLIKYVKFFSHFFSVKFRRAQLNEKLEDFTSYLRQCRLNNQHSKMRLEF